MASRRVVELRVHGVGGSPGPGILGLESSEDIVVVAGGPGTVFLGRRSEQSDDHDGHRVEGYDWGSLTSGAPSQPFWVLLLPFTLANVAGWAHPDDDGLVGRALRGASHLSAGLLTAAWTSWTSVILVDLVAGRWAAPLFARGHWPGPDWLDEALIPAGLALVAVLAWLVYWRARVSQGRAELTPSPLRDAPEPRWRRGEGPTWETFFAHSPSAIRLARVHLAIAGAVLVAAAWETTQALTADAPVDLSHIHRVVMFGSFVVLGVMLALGGSLAVWRGWAALHPFAAAMLAVALTTAVFTGLDLLLTQRLGRWPRRDLALPTGQEVALADLSLLVLISWVAITLAWVWLYPKRGDAEGIRADDLSDGLERLGCPRTGAVPRLREAAAKARGRAMAAQAGARLLVLLAVSGFVLTFVVSTRRFDWDGWLQFGDFQVASRRSLVSQAAAYVFPALVLAAMALVRASATRPKLRRGIGILWDVLTFWPRRYHPFAVRPYTERAVPELQARILEHVERQGRAVLVSAHSQGSVLAFTALGPMAERVGGDVGLLTYGSPIVTLFGSAFPAYFSVDEAAALSSSLAQWTNLYRRTDYIGGPVFGDTNPPKGADLEVPDPAEPPPDSWRLPPVADPEPLRDPWIDLANHSHYHREWIYKEAVGQMTGQLAAGPAT